MKTTLQFLREYATKPTKVGAIAPSSSALAHSMVDWIDWPNVNVAVEYGPGTGAFTGAILERLRPGARYFALEINPAFIQVLTSRYPHIQVFEESVENIAAICERENVQSVDAIICGLPWASFGGELQQRIIDSMMQVLRPGGQFCTFAYLQGLLLPTGQRFRRLLHRTFTSVNTSRITWRNMPPAFVYQCVR